MSVRSVVVLLLVVGGVSAARADDCPKPASATASKRTPEEVATAKSLFDKGLKLQSAGKMDESCKMFESAYHLDPQVGMRLNVAECRELRGRLVEAHALFAEAADEATRKRDPRATYANQRLSALESKIVRVRVQLAEELEGQTIKVAGCEVSKEELSSPRIVMPGTVVVDVTAPGRKAQHVEAAGRAGQELVVEVPVLVPYANAEDERKAKEAEALAAVERRKAEEIAAQRERDLARRYDRHPARPWTLVTGGLGVAALVGGAYFAVRTRRAQDDFDAAGCGDVNRFINEPLLDECTSVRDRGQRDALLANALFVGGGAILAASILVFVIDPGNVERPSTTVSATPTSVQLLVRW
jgi:hypothetical protein